MIIIITSQGQLANRVLHAGHFIANAIEYNHSLIHLSFDEYSRYFNEQLNLPDAKKHIQFLSIRNRLLKTCIRLFIAVSRKSHKLNNGNFILFHYIYLPQGLWKKQKTYDLSSPDFVHKTKKLTFVDGWEFRDELSFHKHRDTLVQIFKPNEQYSQEVSSIVNEFKKKYDILIGVHIRRGDYINFMDGIYNFGDDFYCNAMKQMQLLDCFQEKKILFIICSNEKIDLKNYPYLPVAYTQRPVITDLLILSSCDFIIGPPSTFTMWASYYGGTPMCFLTKENSVLSVESFNIYGVSQLE